MVQAFGAFGGSIVLPGGYQHPVVVASTDGVGTKLHLAIRWGRAADAGRDLVNHCLNDVAVQNARPFAFLDYIASSRLDVEVVQALVDGMAAACRDAGVALLGGETAHMPDTYLGGAYDAVGTIIGVGERARLTDPSRVRTGDVCVGLPSTGLHTNGYSLARRVAERLPPATRVGGETLVDALLAPHPSYLPELARAFELPGVRAAAHITGGGLNGNVPRVLPSGLSARLHQGVWAVPPIFDLIQEELAISEQEMYAVFNMGVGVVIVADRAAADWALAEIDGAFEAGEIVERTSDAVELVDG